MIFERLKLKLWKIWLEKSTYNDSRIYYESKIPLKFYFWHIQLSSFFSSGSPTVYSKCKSYFNVKAFRMEWVKGITVWYLRIFVYFQFLNEFCPLRNTVFCAVSWKKVRLSETWSMGVIRGSHFLVDSNWFSLSFSLKRMRFEWDHIDSCKTEGENPLNLEWDFSFGLIKKVKWKSMRLFQWD